MADIEFFSVLNNVLQSGNIVSMDDIRRLHSVEVESVITNRKVKELIKSHLKYVEFTRP